DAEEEADLIANKIAKSRYFPELRTIMVHDPKSLLDPKIMQQGTRLPVVNIAQDRKSTRLNSSHGSISYAVFCLKKKKQEEKRRRNKKDGLEHQFRKTINTGTYLTMLDESQSQEV